MISPSRNIPRAAHIPQTGLNPLDPPETYSSDCKLLQQRRNIHLDFPQLVFSTRKAV